MATAKQKGLAGEEDFKPKVTVKPKETVISIAKRRNLAPEDILDANPGVVTVRPGQTINVPVPSFAGSINTGGRRGQSGAQGGTGAGFFTGLANALPQSQNTFTHSSSVGGNRRVRNAPPPQMGFLQSVMGVMQGQVGPGNQFYQGNDPTQLAAIGNNSGYALQNGGISTTNQYGVGMTPTPRTGGGKAMPSLVPVNAAPAGYTGTAGYWGAYNQQQNSPALSAARAATSSPSAGYTNLTPSQSQNIPKTASGVSGDKQGAIATPSAPMFPVDEKGKPVPYTGNPADPNTALWKKYWDASAKAGVDLSGRTNTPAVMSRNQIWEMKAAQRRRQSSNIEQDVSQYSDGSFQYDTTDYGASAPLVRNITWSIRG